MEPPDSVEEAFIESQVESFLQQKDTDAILQLCGNRQATALAFQILKRLLLVAQSSAQPASNREPASAESQQTSLLRKQARLLDSLRSALSRIRIISKHFFSCSFWTSSLCLVYSLAHLFLYICPQFAPNAV